MEMIQTQPAFLSDPRFSKAIPGLQVQVNSSSLGPFKACPRQYYYSVVLGLEPFNRSVHLTFGTLIHQGSERYDLNVLAGMEHEAALLDVVEWALRATWDSKLHRPWTSGDNAKTREGAVRTLVWYLDKWNLESPDPCRTVRLASGKPAVELDFAVDSGYRTRADESVIFIGKLDKIIELGGKFFVKDTKTTGHALGIDFYKKFSPDNQFSLYSIAAKTAFDFQVEGLIVDGIEVKVTFSRFDRGLVPRTEEGLDEWLRDSHYWLGQMEACATMGHWPQNDKSCGLYGGCDFREVCAAKPGVRAGLLQRGFRVKTPGVSEDWL